jgi:hypothetical protein
MEIITILVVGGLIAAAFLFFWNSLRDYLNGAFRSWLTEKMGQSVGDGLAHFLAWVDSAAVSAKKLLKEGYAFFKHRVLRMNRKFTKKANSNDVETTREIFTDLGGGKILKRTEEEVISYEDMPDSVRREMVRQQTNDAQLNEKELVIAKARDSAHKTADQELMTMVA